MSARAATHLLSLRAIAFAVDGRVDGKRVRFAPPGHSKADKSAWIELAPNLSDGFYVNTFATGDDKFAIKDWVRQRLGIARQTRRRADIRVAGSRRSGQTIDTGTLETNRARARVLWDEAVDPRGTLVETYLNSRTLELPPDIGALRFHPRLPWNGAAGLEFHPAMIAAIRTIHGDEIFGVHRTVLTPDGCKIDRKMLGLASAAAIKITPDEDVTICLGVGEGIKTTLSLRSIPEFGCSPIWSLTHAGNLAAFPVLAGIETLWIAVDHDDAGIKAAQATAERWQAAGCEVLVVRPTQQGADLNDLIKGADNVL